MSGPSRVAVAAALTIAAPASAQTIAIVHATIYPGSSPGVERGTVLIVRGKIAAIGRDVALPPSARVIEAAGKVVTAGFLDSSTRLGLVEIGAVAGTVDASTRDPRGTAAFNVIDGFNLHSTLIPVTRVEGITRAIVAPETGASIIAGQGILVDLGDGQLDEIVHRNPVALFAALNEDAAERSGGGRGGAVLRLRELLEDAQDYAANRGAFERNERRAYGASRLDLQALVPVVQRELPLAIRADRASDIVSSLRLAREYGLKLILLGAAEGWMVGDQIAAAQVPVVLNPFADLPQFEQLGASLENPARLHRAGVTIALATFDAHNSRRLKLAAGTAVANGLPYETALLAVTATPARIWGIDDEFGTLEPGKDADLVVWSGDPFEATTNAERVFIRGREVPRETRQRELFRRYRSLRDSTARAYIH